MLYYEKIDTSKGIDLTKSNKIIGCMLCHNWFFNHGFEFQCSICNSCHDLTMLSVYVSDIAIITVKDVNCCCIIYDISKFQSINLLK